MPMRFNSVYVTSTGSFLPGAPVSNDDIDRFIAPINATSARIKRRILAENGIATRHYAIDADGRTLHSNAHMAAMTIGDCLSDAEVTLQDVTVLCTGSSGGDLAMPGFANMVQGEMHAPPMSTSSHQGVCAAGMAAMQHAASALELSQSGHALVAASEMPSRMFKRSRFAPRGYETDFDAHFLRWMLSDPSFCTNRTTRRIRIHGARFISMKAFLSPRNASAPGWRISARVRGSSCCRSCGRWRDSPS